MWKRREIKKRYETIFESSCKDALEIVKKGTLYMLFFFNFSVYSIDNLSIFL